jgi:hypothetical protein
VKAPVLVLLPDAEVRVDLTRPVLGASTAARLADAAGRAGFAEVMMAPGTCSIVHGAKAVSTGEPVGGPALLAYESAVIAEPLLKALVERPLAADEGFSLNDGVGRPCGWLTGHLASVPAELPIAEELPWPAGRGPADLARLVYEEDRLRVEEVIWSDRPPTIDEGAAGARRWSRAIVGRLADGGRPLAQIELAATVTAVLAGPAALLGGRLGAVLGAALLCLGVQLAAAVPALARLVRPRGGAADAVWLAPAVRPFGHAAYVSALTYALVAEAGRSSVAGLVLLGLGAGAAYLSLAHARDVLRGERPRFELPSADAFAARLGARLPRKLRSDVRVEIVALALAVTGAPGLPWGVLVGAALARLWRWFVAPRS